MIPIFDLDDTLYQENTFVVSGFRAVAALMCSRFGWDVDQSLLTMQRTLSLEGRGKVFDRLLDLHGLKTKKLVECCIKTYRHHSPTINLLPEANRLLNDFKGSCYLVTDGHKIVQQNKLKALGVENRFKHAYITHRYGVSSAKPSIHCFELIRRREQCRWSDMFYLGDNPSKDFVNLNPLGVHTIRVTTGAYSKQMAKNGYDAKYVIGSLEELRPTLKEIFK